MTDEPSTVPEPIDWSDWSLGATVMIWIGAALLLIGLAQALLSFDSRGLGFALAAGFAGILFFVPGLVLWGFARVFQALPVAPLN